MKLLKKGLLLGSVLFLLSGCFFKRDSMEDITIYTTSYPINYLVDYLYGNNAKIYSIFPTGVNIDEFEISDKKVKEYANSDLFVFNSLDIDRDYAVKLINKNEDLKLIDVSMGMNYDYDVHELWLNPYNYLMMAQNLKNSLNGYISNPYLTEEIENNYETLKYELSKLDATLKELAIEASYKTIVVDNDLFKFLEKYDIRVISLEENENLTEPVINEVKKLIDDGDIKYIYSITNESNDTVKSLLDSYGIELVTINDMRSVDGGVTNTNDSYLTIMNNNIELLKKELLK
mgnify:FL=1